MKTPSTLSSLQISCQQLKWFNTLLLFFLFFIFSTTTSGSTLRISYSDHCASVVPEDTPTVRANILPPQLSMSYYRGGDKILGKINKSTDLYWDDYDTYVSFQTTGDVFETSSRGIYKVRAELYFRLPLVQYSNYPGYGQNYHRSTSLKFLLNGFWSEQSRKLCMVGAAYWSSGEGKPLNLEAVLELNYAKKNSTVFTSLAKGTLKSLSSSDSQSYFEPIEILSFPYLYDYNYTLASKGLAGGCQGGTYIPPKQSLSLQAGGICSRLSWQPFYFDLEYAPSCKSSRDCSPLEVEVATAYMTLYAFQCLENEGKLRYVISFQNNKHGWNYGSFDPKRTLIGEGSWDSERNELCIVACRILNPFKSLGEVQVGDCSIRLSLRFPVIWTIRNVSSSLGLVWTNKTSTEPGYFKSIKFSSSNMNGAASPGLKYEYTETKKVRELCSKHEVKGTGDEYPKGNSYDMRFDMDVEHSKEKIAWGNAVPISVGDTLYSLYGGDSGIIMDLGPSSSSYVEVEEASSYSGQMNISYKLTFTARKLGSQFFPANSSLNDRWQLEISAEGVYDAETGHLCMVGCREFHLPNASEKSLDCEMLIEFQFSPLNSRVGTARKGMIQSSRAKTDPLYFELLNISSSSFYSVEAQETRWRMDLEIVLVLISNTLLCIFVASQIFYVKKYREVLPFISLVMLTVLTLGHMIPLVLNLEALLLKNHNQQNVILRGDGWLELNEVSLRLVTLVVFLLLLRLLQLAWTARKENGDENHFWGAEKKTIIVTLLLYAIGGLITLLVEWRKNGIGHGTLSSEVVPAPARVLQGNISSEAFASTISQQSSILTYLKSYFGLVLDGFLLPQILLNMFRNSRESALSCFFYIGTTIVRLLPHAYDLYRVHYYMRQGFDGSYIYANPTADFYSIAWDLIIPCGCILLALIIWLQQRFGGRCILPKRIRELWSYEKVPVISSE